MSRPWRRAFSLSGTGNVFDSEQVLPSHADGKLEYIITRQDVLGDGTSYTLYGVPGTTAIAAAPDEITRVLGTASVASTPHATAADLEGDLASPRTFQGGLVVGVVMVTAAGGAWVLRLEAGGTLD